MSATAAAIARPTATARPPRSTAHDEQGHRPNLGCQQNGEPQGNEPNDPDTFVALLSELDGESKIALEATYGWEWLAELLEDHGYELHLAHPLRTKAIASARVKTDAVDARTLAHLLRTDLLPEAYVAPRELRDLRDLLRQRVVLTQMRSALKNRVHALLARQGIQRAHADLFGSGGRRFLDQLQLRPGLDRSGRSWTASRGRTDDAEAQPPRRPDRRGQGALQGAAPDLAELAEPRAGRRR